MKVKESIINTAIDLFSERGIRDVSLEMIADKLNIARSGIYYHFKNRKDEIIDNILNIFDNMITENLKNIMECIGDNVTADSILSCLFLTFSKEEAMQSRKINRIIFANYVFVEKIRKYLSEVFYKKRETRFILFFNELVERGKIKPFNTEDAAIILNSLFITYALKDTFAYPYANNEVSHLHDELRNRCKTIVNQILNGNFN